MTPKKKWEKQHGHSYSPAFAKLRPVVRNRDRGMCQRCLYYGLDRAGHEVDHLIPISKGGKCKLDNLWMLCRSCHSEKTQREAHGLSGWPTELDPLTGYYLPPPDWAAVIEARNTAYFDSISF